MATRKNHKSKKSNKIFRKTRSKRQRGGGITCSRLGHCTTDENNQEEDPNTIDEYLALAIEEEAPEAVKQYLDEGANPNITILDEHPQISEQVPIIIYAARHIQPSTILRHLLERHIIWDDMNTPILIEAAEWGNLPAVEYLLDLGADINATTHTGVTAIGYAVMNGDIPMIRLMLDKRRGEIDFNYTAFGSEHENVIDETADPEIAKILKNYAIEQRLPIHSERQKKRLQVGRVMDKKRMPGDLTHKIIIEHFGGKRKTRRSKRQRGGVSEAQRNDELLNLIDLNDPDVRLVIANLLEEGVSPVAKNTALHIASRKGYVELVEMLLNNGADVNATDNNGNTALSFASQNGHTEIVAMLLAARADVNIKSDFGGTALMLASLRGHTEIVAKLLEKGADVNTENNYGQTALSLASLNGHTDIVKLLKQYIVAQTLPRHLERQQNRLQVGRVMDSKKMPGDLTHKIITEHFGGKRKTRKSKKSKKSKRKGRKTRRK